MTGRALRGSLLIPLVLIAFGVVVLLVNFGVLDARETWHVVLRGWPIVIILLGLDLVLSRASAGHAFGVLVLVCVIAAAAFAAVNFAAPAHWITQTVQVHEPLPTASAVEITAACPECSMTLSGGASRDRLVEGSAEVRWLDRFARTSEADGTTFRLELQGKSRLPFTVRSLRDRPVWNLRVADEVAMTVSVSGARCDVDLTKSNVATLYVRADGEASIRLSKVRASTVYVTAESVRIEVPGDVGLVVEGTDAVGQLLVPDDYTRGATSVASPQADAARVRTRIVILPGAERVEIVPAGTDATTPKT
ncbi:MAG: DUF5668 domain-containing protein [Candidatus Bipolaricaulota bacterium]|nr:DUF5668 domain-containing protein [Candidatus Bipolaricaulota bacterium]